MRIPAPPAGGLNPVRETWRTGTTVWRCHETKLGANEFNPGQGQGRFHPITDSATGTVIPTLYGAGDISGALSESVFRNVPVRGPSRRVRGSALKTLCLSALIPRRDLGLANLSGNGLGRIGVRRSELIESSATHYRQTAMWAEAIHRQAPVDGLLWVSRQNDRALAILLFGDRVGGSDMDVLVDSQALDHGTGWNYVLRAAEEAQITVVL